MTQTILANDCAALIEHEDAIYEIQFNRANRRVNTIDQHFVDGLTQLVKQIVEQDNVVGVLLTSTKETFIAGGDLDFLGSLHPDQAEEAFNLVEGLKASIRALEQATFPVVACLQGSALGGGWEVALGANFRIALNHPGIRFGLPEATLGLLPGGGGVTRMVRLFGWETSAPYLLQGKLIKPMDALDNGWIHELVEDPAELLRIGKRLILDNPQVQQPWDVKGYKIPGGTPKQGKLAAQIAFMPPMLFKETQYCYPAQSHILSTAADGLSVDFDTASRIESRYFVDLALGKVAKNMITTFWHQMNAMKAHDSRPVGESTPVKKMAIIGAGMMGHGIAQVSAAKGVEVVLIDQTLQGAEAGKAKVAANLEKLVAKGRKSAEDVTAILARITPSERIADCYDVDLAIEAVFEDTVLKQNLLKELEQELPAHAILASNTSTIPISELNQQLERPEQCLGLHFFSPVERMPLVEIIKGDKTANDALRNAYDFVVSLGKTAIVVNDGRGFYTTRVFSTYTREGLRLLNDGAPAALIENLAKFSGFPVGPLAVLDEVSLQLMENIRKQVDVAGNHQDMTERNSLLETDESDNVLDQLIARERIGRKTGKGIYDYPEGEKKTLWSGLDELFDQNPNAMPNQDVIDRLIFIQALEAVHCIEANIVTHVRDANLGSIMGVGFPRWTGGALQFINGYGIAEFVARAHELTERYGDRFRPTGSLEQMATNYITYKDE